MMIKEDPIMPRDKSKSRMARDKKGLSPIFAALIMLGVVTALFIPIFAWSTGLTAGVQSFWEMSGLAATERIEIEEVNLKGGRTDSTIYVRNIGRTSAIITEVNIEDEETGLQHLYTSSTFTIIDPVAGNTLNSMGQGDLASIYIINLAPISPQKDKTYTVSVYTSRGVGAIYQVKA